MIRLKQLLIILLLLHTIPSWAESDSQYLLTEKTYKALSAAQELMGADKNAQAEKQLNNLLNEVAAGSYEQAVVQQTLGYLYSSKGDYKKASQMFKKALDSKALPDKVSLDLQYNLGQLLLADDQYKKGVQVLEQWLKNESSPPNSARVLLASAYYRLKQYNKAIEHIRIAVKKDKSPKEAWYQLWLSAHLELKQYKSAIKVLEILVSKYPYNKTYWSQLSSLYLQQNKDFTAVAVKMLAQRLELGDGKTLINLADMYRYLRVPYKSGQLLEKGLADGVIDSNYENLTKLADSWLAAKENDKAVVVLEKLRGLDKSGQSDLKLGRVLFGMEKWQESEQALLSAQKKLSGSKVGTVALLLGMTQFHQEHLQQAKKYFLVATKYKNERNQAGQWLRHIDRLLEAQSNAKPE